MNEDFKPLGFIVPGRPIAWARAGYSKGHFYDRQEKEKVLFKHAVSEAYGGAPLEGPLFLGALFCFSVPKSITGLKREEMLGKERFIRPDTDNLLKFISDCLQGILYNDDCQLAEIHAKKVWDEENKTVIVIDSLLNKPKEEDPSLE